MTHDEFRMTKESRMTKHEDSAPPHGSGRPATFGFRHSFVIACLLAAANAQDSAETIKIGPLQPLQTLPSLSSQPAPAPVLPPAAEMKPAATPAPPSAQAAPPPLPTSNALIIKEPLAQAYLYVEPYQTRFEVLFDAATLLSWLSPDAILPATLTAEQQRQLSEKAATRAVNWCTMSSGDASLATPQLYVSVIKGLPVFGTQSETAEINATVKTHRWRNQGRLPRPAPLTRVPQYEASEPVRVPFGAIAWLLGGLVFYTYLKVKDYRLPGGSMPYLAVWLLGAMLMSQLLVIPIQTGSGSPVITQVDEAQSIVTPLLRNVYRAFDHRVESDVYDVLERSVDGELLRKLYLETIQALTLEGREGTRVTIAEFSATVDKVEANTKGEGFSADCNWMARGIVGHWGHSHPRVNIYDARVTITPAKGEWKLIGLEVQEVRRL